MGPVVRGRFKAEPAARFVEAADATAQVSTEARLLALAYAIKQAVENGHYRSVADVAHALGLSRARLSQFMRRRWATAGEQEDALGAFAGGQDVH